MDARDDMTTVLAQWGDDGLDGGPMNGSVGLGVSNAVLAVVAANQPPPAGVCELGCGNGFLAARLAAQGYGVVGVDASGVLLKVARAHHQSSRVEFRQGLFGPELAASLADRQFDLVVSVDVIEHLYRPMTLIETAHAILRPGGRLIVCTPYHGYLKNVAISVLDKWDWHHSVHSDGGHIKFFSRASLARMVGRRFSVDGFSYHGRVRWLWRNMLCIATKPVE